MDCDVFKWDCGITSDNLLSNDLLIFDINGQVSDVIELQRKWIMNLLWETLKICAKLGRLYY